MCLNINDIAIITVRNADYYKLCMKTWYGSKFLLFGVLGQIIPKYILENIQNNLAHKDLI